MLYNLFEWPSKRNARLVVVGIANTIDLPERCLPRVSSRVTSRLTFGPYQKQQVCVLVAGRLLLMLLVLVLVLMVPGAAAAVLL